GHEPAERVGRLRLVRGGAHGDAERRAGVADELGGVRVKRTPLRRSTTPMRRETGPVTAVETYFKGPRKRSPQRQRRLDWEREYDAAKKVVDARSGGVCE